MLYHGVIFQQGLKIHMSYVWDLLELVTLNEIILLMSLSSIP